MPLHRTTWVLMVLTVLIVPASATLKAGDRKKKVETKVTGTVEESVRERGLVTQSPKWREIVEQHASHTRHAMPRAVRGHTLAYVTPWNNRGYDIVKEMGGKFSLVSPVWLQVRRLRQVGGAGVVVTGEHDVDQGWLREVRRAGRHANVKVVPRLLFDGWQASDYRELFASENERLELANTLLDTIKTHQLDGLVVEVWSQVPSRELLQQVPGFLLQLASRIRSAGHTFILVIPPPIYRTSPGSFQREHFEALVDAVDAFSLMTYDFSSFQEPGPNSPLWWARKCVEVLVPDPSSPHRAKLLLGLNLYGLDHSVTGGSHVLGPQYVNTLATYKPKIKFDDEAQEHYFEYKPRTGRHVVFYPTLYSVDARVQLANTLGTGVSLWEVGQGLDYFYDLL